MHAQVSVGSSDTAKTGFSQHVLSDKLLLVLGNVYEDGRL